MACGLQNGRGQPESVFLCFLHLQWINLFFAVSPLHGLSFLQNTTPKKEQKQTNKKPRNSTKKEHQPKKPKNKETKQIAHPKRGKMQRIGSRHVFCFVCFFGLLSFWFLVSFEGLAEQKKWQDLTFCYFSQLRVCKIVFFIDCCGSVVSWQNYDKTTEKCRYHRGNFVGLGHGLGNFMSDSVLKICQKIMQNIGSQSICRIDFDIGIFQSKP